jgi:hypothetical protein
MRSKGVAQEHVFRFVVVSFLLCLRSYVLCFLRRKCFALEDAAHACDVLTVWTVADHELCYTPLNGLKVRRGQDRSRAESENYLHWVVPTNSVRPARCV